MHFGNLADIDAIRDKSPAISAGVSPRKATVGIACLAAVAAGANPLTVYKVVTTLGPWLLGKRVL